MVSRRTDRTPNPFLITGDVVALMANYGNFGDIAQMKNYFSLPLAQRRTQQRVDQFNAAEAIWRALELKRLRRRARCQEVSPELHRQLDLLDFANAQSRQDCIGFVLEPSR